MRYIIIGILLLGMLTGCIGPSLAERKAMALEDRVALLESEVLTLQKAMWVEVAVVGVATGAILYFVPKMAGAAAGKAIAAGQ